MVRWRRALCALLAVTLPVLALTGAPTAGAADPPTVTTNGPEQQTRTSAEVFGTVTSSVPATDCHFDYGISTSYEASVPCRTLPGAGTTVVAAPITGLTPETTYHYRLSVTTEGGTGLGGDRTFKTFDRPEYGTCVKVPVGTGEYSSGSCTTPGGEKKYEWHPAFGTVKPLVKTHFTLQLKEKTEARLYSHGQDTVACTGATGSGVYTGNKSIGDVTLTLSGCHIYEGVSICTSSGAGEGQIVLPALGGTLGILKQTALEEPAKAAVGTDLKPVSGEVWASFSCGVMQVTVIGGVIGEVKRNSMTTKNFIKFVATSKAAQQWRAFAGQNQERLLSEWPETTWSALNLALVLTSEEKLEVNGVV